MEHVSSIAPETVPRYSDEPAIGVQSPGHAELIPLSNDSGARTVLPAQMDSEEIEAKIEELRDVKVLETPQMVDLYQWLDAKRLARQSCRIIGASRTGKTFSCDTYRFKYPPIEQSGCLPIIPVLYWHCWDKLRLSGLFVGLLDAVGCELLTGNTNQLRLRTYESLEKCQVEMLIVDEAQRIASEVMSEIRDISDKLEISVVLVGTDRLNAVIKRDEQVKRRFRFGYQFASLSVDGVREMTGLWEAHVLNLPEPSNLTSDKAQTLLLHVTQGYIGVLSDVLREAAIQSWYKRHPRIKLSTLKQVVQSCLL